MNIVLTRPYQDSLKLKQIIESSSPHKCYIQPVMEIDILHQHIAIADNSAVVLTSVNSVRALAANTKIRDYKIITVGNQSALEAKECGFTNVTSAVTANDQNANEQNLIRYITNNINKSENIYHISANITKGGLKKKLKKAGYKYERMVLYNSKPTEFSEEFKQKLIEGEFDYFTFFSPRSAAIFAKQIIACGFAPVIYKNLAFCFSENVVMGLIGLNFDKIIIPEVTNAKNFITLLCTYKSYSQFQ